MNGRKNKNKEKKFRFLAYLKVIHPGFLIS